MKRHPHLVGTGGGCEEGWGPCACPRAEATRWHYESRTNRVATRTGTRPPHPLSPSLCPYRTLGPLAALFISQFSCHVVQCSEGEKIMSDTTSQHRYTNQL